MTGEIAWTFLRLLELNKIGMRRIQDVVNIVFWECQNKYLFPILTGTESKGLWPIDMEKKKKTGL